MKRLFSVVAVALLALSLTPATAQSLSSKTKWHWENNQIVTDVPAREPGQQTALELTRPKMDVVRVGFVGLGMRGSGALWRWPHIPGVEIVALCDAEQNRVEAAQGIIRKLGMPPAEEYWGAEGYKKLCERKDIDLVYVATDWLHHFPVAKYAMEHGKNVAIEVPSAMNLDQCWELVNLSEKTRLHCMILENCCYDWFEINTLNMAQHGLFGEIIRVQGAYLHSLEPFWNAYWKEGADDKLGWRLQYNKDNRGDVYATHGFGPVAQLLNIHRGDKLNTLVAMDTKSFIGEKLVEKATGEKCSNFRNGDHTTTLLSTENGKVIEIQHDVMTPKPYSRLYQLIGTKGYANKYPVSGYALEASSLKESGVTPQYDKLDAESFLPEAEKAALEKKYESPVITKYAAEAKEVGGHGGMDYIMDARLVYCMRNGLPLDMDVYDLAEWCCTAELSALSMDNGNAPVVVPDFTRGDWKKINGYKHAFVSPAEDAESTAVARAFTKKLKEGAAKAWEKYDKKHAKK